MPTSLRDIPGASRPRSRRAPGTWPDGPRPAVLFDPREGSGRRRRPFGGFEGRARRLRPLDVVLAVGALIVVFVVARGIWSATRVHVEITGLRGDDAMTFAEASDLRVAVEIGPEGGRSAAELLLDGRPLADARRTDEGFEWRNDGPLTAGVHRLELSVPRPILPASRFRWTFLVDAEAPTIDAPAKTDVHDIDEPVVVRGRVDTDATLTANGRPVDLDDEGRFRLSYARPPAGPILLEARDAAGYAAKHEVFVPLRRPRVRGVHMTAISWNQPELRKGVFDLIDQGRINTVELDLKDESGEVGYDTEVPLAREIGAAKRYYDLRDAVETLHRRGIRVIGRIVVYRDPILATEAWKDGRRDWVLQKPDGTPHGAYGGFTNLASREVRQYNLDIALEAANAGVDEILWDYIRRPEGDLGQIVFPGMPSTDEAVQRSVADFLARGHQVLRAKGVFQGASLFGVAAARPTTVGQNVPDIARRVDYIAPMVYPSLWVAGEYRVPDPTRMPFAIVVRSLEDFQARAAGTSVIFTPWLQDFSLGTTYRDLEVAEQIRGAEEIGIRDWLLWSPRVVYHGGMIEPEPADDD